MTELDDCRDRGSTHHASACNVARLARLERVVAQLRVLELPACPDGMDDNDYTDWLCGAGKFAGKSPYAERRFRQCSIGWHRECSDPDGEECQCPCHGFIELALEALAALDAETEAG